MSDDPDIAAVALIFGVLFGWGASALAWEVNADSIDHDILDTVCVELFGNGFEYNEGKSHPSFLIIEDTYNDRFACSPVKTEDRILVVETTQPIKEDTGLLKELGF